MAYALRVSVEIALERKMMPNQWHNIWKLVQILDTLKLFRCKNKFQSAVLQCFVRKPLTEILHRDWLSLNLGKSNSINCRFALKASIWGCKFADPSFDVQWSHAPRQTSSLASSAFVTQRQNTSDWREIWANQRAQIARSALILQGAWRSVSSN